MKTIDSFDLASHVELQEILSKATSFYKVYDSVINSRGILGRYADDNKGNSNFWADIADLYDGRAIFSTELLYVINLEINNQNFYLNTSGGIISPIAFSSDSNKGTKYTMEDINKMNPKLKYLAIPVDQKERDADC